MLGTSRAAILRHCFILQSLLDTEINEEPSKSQSPIGNLRKKHHILTPRQSERALGIIEQPSGSKSISRGSTKTRFSGIGQIIYFYYLFAVDIICFIMQ